MKNKKVLLPILAIGLVAADGFAQRGIPPKDVTKSLSVTKYSQVMDFKTEMLTLLKVPAGWEVSLAASGLGKPRMLYTSPEGNVYVTRRDGGDVLMLQDKDGDNKFENLVTVLADFKGVHGITMKDGWMYLANSNEVKRYPVKPDGMLDVPKGELLIKDLPDGGQHPNRTLDFGPDGMLYISVGSLCNDCKESDKETAVMLQVDPKNWSRKLYASGLRNTIG